LKFIILIVFHHCSLFLSFLLKYISQVNGYQLFTLYYTCCSNHLPEQHLWYADFSKVLSRLSSSGDYKRTRQGALAALLLYLYKLHVVYATTILTCPYVHALFSCPITHLHVFSLRPPCFLYVPWHHTFNLYCTCVHHVYTMRNPCPLTSFLTLTLI